MSIIVDKQTTIDSLNEAQRSYLKTAILHSLQTQEEDLNRRSQLTTNPDIKKMRDIIRKASKKKIKWEVFFDKSHKYI